MCEVPLTQEQRIFAAEHHDLVYKYLQENHLPKDEFYDVIIFGYLKAVRDYFSQENLRRYAFTTIAWKSMTQTVSNYYRKQVRQRNNIQMLSIHTELNEDNFHFGKNGDVANDMMIQLETELLLHDLAKRLSKQQMEMVHLRNSGYGIRDVARSQNLSLRHAKELLEEVRLILLQLCNE